MDRIFRIGLPMMPMLKGSNASPNRVFSYSIVLFTASFFPLTVRFGWIYFAAGIIFGIQFMKLVYFAGKHERAEIIKKVFTYSLIYRFAPVPCTRH